ncbi:MAG: rod shape-determining protein MreC [Candidatus Berkelbacteria bacterium Licking1014_85]|uniref:Cell shape-determining protein MreC n=1 Tax=Candidatus Berkelbacteria bacterium Licking1014_85 TaxID=2017148 RepID=A0A554LKD1_9BACT|nr:MAG: rod shape-determining protein MreC [Candidatus Berkelbacteria bacterium Licking1014_85]
MQIRNYKIYNYYILIVIAIAIFLIFSKSKTLKNIRGGAIRTIAPIVSFEKKIIDGISYPFRFVKNMQSVMVENQELKKQLTTEKEKNTELGNLKYENQILKKELNIQPETKDQIGASVIGRSPFESQSIIYIDKGERDGLETKMVATSNGFLIGILTDVQKKSSTITLVNDYSTMIPVISVESRGLGLLKYGINGLAMEDIPITSNIKTGEKIVTSGLVGRYPADIPIGEIDKIISEKSNIYQTAQIKTPVDLKNLTYVFVSKKTE